MFTGIVTAIGIIEAIQGSGDLCATIACPFDPAAIAIGASIACSGCCLTVVDRGGAPGAAWFAVDISGETIACTVPGRWQRGARLNLEPALRIGDELGGHIVSGHVDGVGEVVSMAAENQSVRWRVRAPAALARYIAAKGSVAVDGVSLTVNEVEGAEFGVNIIAHTAAHTGFGVLRPGDAVNLEIDMLARYVARLAEFQ